MLLAGLPVVAYGQHAARTSLPNGGTDAEVVVGSLLCAVLYSLMLYGAARRLRSPKPPEDSLQPLCGTCGYSLRGNVSGRCPECGCEIMGRSNEILHGEGPGAPSDRAD